jgi:ubiquinone/menaquinone biosynthesis C-methylase UbiE
MNVYSQHVFPRFIHFVMNAHRLDAYRERLASQAQGTVLELGFGSGRNLPFYRPQQVAKLYAVEPEVGMLELGEKHIASAPFPVEILLESAEHISLPDQSIDTVICSWTLCSIPDLNAALTEVRRVLRPDGVFLFAEHGLAPEARIAQWQHYLTPLWRRCVGGCHLDRPIDQLLTRAGFDIVTLTNSYLSAVKAMSYMYEGRAYVKPIT